MAMPRRFRLSCLAAVAGATAARGASRCRRQIKPPPDHHPAGEEAINIHRAGGTWSRSGRPR
jgi:hypothetical protein